MPLLRRAPNYHTTELFHLAARRRFEEATRSIASDDLLIGVYLAGYAAEMILKAAYFRLSGKSPSDPINPKTDLKNAKDHAKTSEVAWGTNYHDLSAWTRLLIEVRKIGGSAYEADFARTFTTQIAKVQDNWREDLRYQINRPRPEEVNGTFQAVAWLMANYRRL